MVGYYTLQTVCVSIHPSALRFRTNLCSFWPNILQTLHGHWYQGGVVWDFEWTEFSYTELWPFIDVKMFFLNIFRTNGWILIKFCICIDTYKIHIVFNAHYFWSIFKRVIYGPWSTSEFCLCSISCELICGFRSDFVFALLLTRYRFGWLNSIYAPNFEEVDRAYWF